MQKRISGGKTVYVTIGQLGKNYFPDIEDLRDRYIKYIDYIPVGALVGSSATPISQTAMLSVSLATKRLNYYKFINLPISRLDVTQNYGERVPVMSKLTLPNCYLFNEDASKIGQVVALTFWYDEQMYSRKNSTDLISIDSFEKVITSNTNKVFFDDNRTLVNKRFRNFLVDFPTTTPLGNTSINQSEAQNVYISFVKGNYAIIDRVPLLLFYQLGFYNQFDFSNIVFDFTSSFVEVAGSQDLTGKAVFINVVFEQN